MGRNLLQSERHATLFIDVLRSYVAAKKFTIHEFVVMPNHVHLLITLDGTMSIEKAMQFIKGGYSHAFGVEFGKRKEVWQRGFTDHRIRGREDFEKHRQYIHNNPVVRRLVGRAAEYRYCSAYPGFKLDGVPSAAKAAVA